MLSKSAAGSPRLRVLSVVSSSNQLYSGIGRALFALARWQSPRVAFTFAIDDANARNVTLLTDLGRELGARVHVGRALKDPGGLDTGNADLPELLGRDEWDLIETVCFANTTTNAVVLEHVGDRPLVYTPHDQPLWTVPTASAEQARHIAQVHQRMVERADAVLCDSRLERAALQRLAPSRAGVLHLPLGCDFVSFEPGADERPPQLLFVGDLVEPRKRFDRALAAFAQVRRLRPDMRLVVVGNRSQSLGRAIPPGLRVAVELRGFVTEDELRRAYSESAGFLLLSDYEAFGMPILESLVSRTPAFVSSLAATRSVFSSFQGAIFCPEHDAGATAARIVQSLDHWPELRRAMQEDERRLRATFDWATLSARKWELMAAAWHRRRGFALAG